MIKNEELGIEIAESEDEALFTETLETAKKDRENLLKQLKVTEVAIEAFENKLKELEK